MPRLERATFRPGAERLGVGVRAGHEIATLSTTIAAGAAQRDTLAGMLSLADAEPAT